MDFKFSEELNQFREKVRKFGQKEFTPERARKFDLEEKYPDELRKLAYQQGLVDYSDPWKVMISIEELCSIDPGLGISVTIPYFGAEVILLFGSDLLKEKYLSRVNSGEAIMGLAVTEPSGGSDVAGSTTRAEKKGDKYVVSGSKMFISNGNIADFLVTLVRTSEGDGKRHHGLSVLVIDTGSTGFNANKLTGKLGVRATTTAEISMQNVEVPAENLVGEEGKGFYYIMTFFNISRIFVAAQGIGIAQGAYNRALELVKKRGESFSGKEEVQFILAEMATKIKATRLVTYEAASYLFNFEPDPAITSMAKQMAGETAVFVAEKALELAGIEAVDGDLERIFRDAKILEIWEGTSEIEKLVISRNLLKGGKA